MSYIIPEDVTIFVFISKDSIMSTSGISEPWLGVNYSLGESASSSALSLARNTSPVGPASR